MPIQDSDRPYIKREEHSPLDPDKMYKVEEINLMPGKRSFFQENGKVFSGDYLMKVGLRVFTGRQTNSSIFEITAQ